MSKIKGKTWEEIYGVEEANKRRLKIKQKSELGLLTKSTKGKKWEDIYSEEEVIKRKQKMKDDNPIHKMSEETAKNRSEKLSNNMSQRTGKDNPMFGKNHSNEMKQNLSEKRNSKEWKNTIQVKINEIKKEKHLDYIIKDKCLYCNNNFEYLSYDTRTFCSQQCAGRWKLENGIFKKDKPNGWEQIIIDFNIDNIKFVGDHSFWITLFSLSKDKFVFKNPDFIFEPFSETKKVIEVWGDWWHRNDDINELKEMYENKNIKVLFLRNEDIKQSQEVLLNKIRRFLFDDSQQNKVN